VLHEIWGVPSTATSRLDRARPDTPPQRRTRTTGRPKRRCAGDVRGAQQLLHRLRVAEIEQDIISTSDYLTQAGAARIGTLGFSMGATIAYWTAARMPVAAVSFYGGGIRRARWHQSRLLGSGSTATRTQASRRRGRAAPAGGRTRRGSHPDHSLPACGAPPSPWTPLNINTHRSRRKTPGGGRGLSARAFVCTISDEARGSQWVPDGRYPADRECIGADCAGPTAMSGRGSPAKRPGFPRKDRSRRAHRHQLTPGISAWPAVASVRP
jgi:hypothetical protein